MADPFSGVERDWTLQNSGVGLVAILSSHVNHVDPRQSINYDFAQVLLPHVWSQGVSGPNGISVDPPTAAKPIYGQMFDAPFYQGRLRQYTI